MLFQQIPDIWTQHMSTDNMHVSIVCDKTEPKLPLPSLGSFFVSRTLGHAFLLCVQKNHMQFSILVFDIINVQQVNTTHCASHITHCDLLAHFYVFCV